MKLCLTDKTQRAYLKTKLLIDILNSGSQSLPPSRTNDNVAGTENDVSSVGQWFEAALNDSIPQQANGTFWRTQARPYTDFFNQYILQNESIQAKQKPDSINEWLFQTSQQKDPFLTGKPTFGKRKIPVHNR
jgi:hypothetical protein